MIFSANIPDTTGRQMTITFPHQPTSAAVLHVPGQNRTSKMCAKNKQKKLKNIPDIIDCNLKKDRQILVAFTRNISATTGHQMTVQVFTSFDVCFCTTCEKQNKQNMP